MIGGADCTITLSRGSLREGFAALEAFGDLLGSRRVGPRALERAKVDTLDACLALAAALGPFESTLVVGLGKDEPTEAAVHVLVERLKSHVSALATALADDGPMSARRRLSLEASFRQHRADLRDCIALCELAVGAAKASVVDLDLLDLLEQRHGERIAEGHTVRVGIDSARPVTIRADRHVLTGILETAASFACRGGRPEARVVAGINTDGTFVVRVGPPPRGWSSAKRTVSLPVRGDIDLAVQIAQVVGPRSGLGVSFDQAASSVSIVSKSPAVTC